MTDKIKKTLDDVARIVSKPDESVSKSQDASDNPFLHPYSLDTFGKDESGGETIIEKVLNRKEVLQIFAPSGVGKSIYVDNVIAALLAAEPVFGEFTVTKPHDVYLLEAEMSPQERGERLRSIAQKSGAHFYAMSLSGFKLNNAQHFAKLSQAMHHFKPAVIVIDPWRAAHTANENDSTEIELVVGNVRQLMFEINASVIIVHHAGRDFVTRDGQIMPRHSRGSTVLDERSDVIWEIERTNHENITILRNRKLRGFRKEMAAEYTMHYDRMTGILVSVSKRGEHADAIRSKRQQLKLTQEELAQKLSVTGRMIKYYEAGKYNVPEEMFERLSKM